MIFPHPAALYLLFPADLLNRFDEHPRFFEPTPDLFLLKPHHVRIVAFLAVVEQSVKELTQLYAYDAGFYEVLVKQRADAAMFCRCKVAGQCPVTL